MCIYHICLYPLRTGTYFIATFPTFLPGLGAWIICPFPIKIPTWLTLPYPAVSIQTISPSDG